MKRDNEIKRPTFKLDKMVINKPVVETENLSLANVKIESEKSSIESKFNFIKAHRGYQPGHLHLLLGRTNKGKSTLILSLIAESVLNGHNCILYISEGLKHEIREGIEAIIRIKREDSERHLKRVTLVNDEYFSVDEITNPARWVNKFFNLAYRTKSELVFFDNFSTSPFGDSSPEIQASFVRKIKEKAQSSNLPVFGAVHPTKNVSMTKKLELPDIRANLAFSSVPSFIYGFNDIPQKGGIRILEILKARKNGAVITGTYYELFYKSLKGEGYYHKDVLIPTATAEKTLRANTWQKPTARN